MSKTVELRTELRNHMLEACSNVYYEEAPTPYRYPYVVYEIQELSHTDGKTLCQMEVNAIDYGKDSKRIENISDQVQDIFNHLYVLTSGLQFSVHMDRRQIVREQDKKVLRRRMLFEIHLHERR